MWSIYLHTYPLRQSLKYFQRDLALSPILNALTEIAEEIESTIHKLSQVHSQFIQTKPNQFRLITKQTPKPIQTVRIWKT